VTADTRARIERLKPERLCFSCINNLMQIDSEAAASLCELIHQSDVDMPVCILEQFRHLCFLGTRDRYHAIHDLLVELCRALSASRGDAAEHFGGVAESVHWITRVDALRGE